MHGNAEAQVNSEGNTTYDGNLVTDIDSPCDKMTVASLSAPFLGFDFIADRVGDGPWTLVSPQIDTGTCLSESEPGCEITPRDHPDYIAPLALSRGYSYMGHGFAVALRDKGARSDDVPSSLNTACSTDDPSCVSLSPHAYAPPLARGSVTGMFGYPCQHADEAGNCLTAVRRAEILGTETAERTRKMAVEHGCKGKEGAAFDACKAETEHAVNQVVINRYMTPRIVPFEKVDEKPSMGVAWAILGVVLFVSIIGYLRYRWWMQERGEYNPRSWPKDSKW